MEEARNERMTKTRPDGAVNVKTQLKKVHCVTETSTLPRLSE